MSDFKAKMHQIRLRRWANLQHSPGPLAGFKGPTSKGGMGREGTTYKGREGKRRGSVPPVITVSHPHPRIYEC